MRIKNHEKDNEYGFVALVATGHTFNIHWKEGIDWTNLFVGTSQSWEENDDGIIVNFNYTDYREQFYVQRLVAGISDTYNIPTNPNL